MKKVYNLGARALKLNSHCKGIHLLCILFLHEVVIFHEHDICKDNALK